MKMSEETRVRREEDWIYSTGKGNTAFYDEEIVNALILVVEDS